MGTLSRKAVWGAALALWVMIPAATATASSGSNKVDKVLQQSSGSLRSVIVQTKSGAAKNRVKARLPKRGNGPSEHQLIPAFTMRLDGKEIAALVNDPDVLSVSVDADVTGLASKKKAASTTTTTTTSASSSTTSEYTTVSLVKKTLG